MPNPGYVRSTDGSDADNGSTWALANATLAAAMTDQAAGDRVWISDAHNENAGGVAITVTGKGTLAAPMQYLCGDDAAEPPTALAASAAIGNTGGNAITFNGHFFARGLTINTGTGSSTAVLIQCSLGGDVEHWDGCVFNQNTTDAGSHIHACGVNNDRAGTRCVWTNCNVKLSAAGQSISISGGVFEWRGGSLVSGGVTTTGLIRQTTTRAGVRALIDSVDLSAGAAGMGLSGPMSAGAKIVFRNCKLPASWSGALCATSPPAVGSRAEMWNCDSADTNYRMWIEDYCGSIKSETTYVKTGGASDGTTPLSWKMASSANAEYPIHIVRSPEIPSEWIESVGSAKTITVDVLHDSATNLKDDEIWLEVQYLGTSGVPLGSFISDAKADILAAAADQTASSATWTTTSMTNPNKQKLSVTFTPQEKGVAYVTVCVAKPSYTVYVDPKAQVS